MKTGENSNDHEIGLPPGIEFRFLEIRMRRVPEYLRDQQLLSGDYLEFQIDGKAEVIPVSKVPIGTEFSTNRKNRKSGHAESRVREAVTVGSLVLAALLL